MRNLRQSLFGRATSSKDLWVPLCTLWAIVSILVAVLLGILAIFMSPLPLLSCAVIVVASGYVFAILTAFHRFEEFWNWL